MNSERFQKLLDILKLKKYKNIFLDSDIENIMSNVLDNTDISFLFYEKIEEAFILTIDLDKKIYGYVNKSEVSKINANKIPDFISFYLENVSRLIKKINYIIKNDKSIISAYSFIRDYDPKIFIKTNIYKYFNLDFIEMKNICIVDRTFFNFINKFKNKDLFIKFLKKISTKIISEHNTVFIDYTFKNFYNEYIKLFSKKEVYILWYIYNILKIYKQNYANRDIFVEFLFKRLLSIFLDSSINERSKLYIIRSSHDVLSFFALKTDKNNKNEKLFISFNTKNYLNGYGIGRYLFNKIITNELKKGFSVSADSDFSMIKEYVENFNFIVYKVSKADLEDEIYAYIRINKKIKDSIYFSKEKYSQKDIVRLKNKFNNEDSGCFIKEFNNPTDNKIFKFLDDFVNKKKYIVTRYFNINNTVYIALERSYLN